MQRPQILRSLFLYDKRMNHNIHQGNVARHNGCFVLLGLWCGPRQAAAV